MPRSDWSQVPEGLAWVTMNPPAVSKSSTRGSGYHQKALAEIRNSLLPFANSGINIFPNYRFVNERQALKKNSCRRNWRGRLQRGEHHLNIIDDERRELCIGPERTFGRFWFNRRQTGSTPGTGAIVGHGLSRGRYPGGKYKWKENNNYSCTLESSRIILVQTFK